MSSTVYSDSSVLIAWFNPRDVNGEAVDAWMTENCVGFAYNALHRLEVRLNLRKRRKRPYGETAWQALRAAENSGATLRGYGADVLGLFQRAERLSAELAEKSECGSLDLLHLAGAMEAEALFVTCDVAQAKAARLVKLDCVLIGE